MPDLVKIGSTTGRVEDRIKELSDDTAVPVAFKCHFAAEVMGAKEKERRLRSLFSEERVNPKREFFKVAPERVVDAIRMGRHKVVTPGKVGIPPKEELAFEKADKTESRRRSRIQLEKIGVRPETKLTFTRDSKVHATVVAGNRLRIDDKALSITAAAKHALKRIGIRWPHVQGPLYWKYKGDTLDEIRRRRE
jgi:hypothetical protein